MNMEMFWSVVGAFCIIVILAAVIFGIMFEGTQIFNNLAERVKRCNHEWVVNPDAETITRKVMVCTKCGKIHEVRQ